MTKSTINFLSDLDTSKHVGENFQTLPSFSSLQANILGKICKEEKEGRIYGQGLLGYCQSNIEKIHFVFFLLMNVTGSYLEYGTSAKMKSSRSRTSPFSTS